MYIVIDSTILYTTEQKREFLSGMTEDEIAEIRFLDRKTTANSLGLKSRHGTMLIKTKDGSYSFHKCNPDSMERAIKKRQVSDFKRFPAKLLNDLDKMGVDSSSMLNDYEAKYLNFIFGVTPDDFDFAGKKIGFITGSSGKKKSNKADYFKLEKDRFCHKYSPNGGDLYVFDKRQKEESGGYDAAIVYWSKFILPVEKVIEGLKKK